MADIDDIRFVIRAELKDFEKGLNKAKKKGKETAQDIQKQFTNAFTAIAASKAIGKIRDVFSAAITASNKFEAALLGVDAAAKQAGESVEDVREQVLELTEDGTLGVEQVATSFKLLLSAGTDAEQAFKLTEAVKQIASLNNIVGDAGQATADFFKGVLTGSAELIENADPALRTLAKSVGGFAEVSKSASARQEFFNKVIEKGTALTEDYQKFLESGTGALKAFDTEQEKLLATLGDTIKSGFAPLLNIATKVIRSFRDFFESLSPGTRVILVVTSALVVLVPAIIAAGTALLGLAGGFAGIVTLLGGPVVLAIGAVALAIGGLAIVIDKFNNATVNTAKSLVKTAKETEKLRDEITALENQTKRTAVQEKRLIALQIELAKQAEAGGIALEKQNGALKTQSELTEELNLKKAQSIVLLINEEVATLRNLEASAKKNKILTAILGVNFQNAIKESKETLKVLGDQLGAITGVQTTTEKLGRATFRVNRKIKDSFKGVTDFLKNEFEKAIESNIERFQSFIKSLNQAVARGLISREEADRQELEAQRLLFTLQKKVLADARTRLLEFNDDVLQLTLNRIDDETKAAIEAIDFLAKKGILSAKEVEAEKSKIAQSAQRKRTQAELDAATNTIGGINDIFSGVGQIAEGGLSSILGGAAQFGDLIAPGLGQVFGALGGITSLFEDLFDNTEALAKQEAEREKQEERVRRIIEAQRKLQEELIRLEQSRKQLIADTADLQIRLNNLLIKDDEERRQANQQILTDLLGAQAKELFPDIDPQARPEEVAVRAAGEIDALALQELANQTALVNFQALLDSGAFDIRTSGLTGRDDTQRKLNKDLQAIITTPNLSPRIKQEMTTLLRSINRTFDKGEGEGQLIGDFTREAQIPKNIIGSVQTDVTNLLSGLDQLIGTSERVAANVEEARKSADIRLQEGRAVSFIDIGRRGVRDISGQFIGAQVPALGVPSGVSGVALAATETTKSFQERSTDALENIFDELIRQTQLLAVIAASTDESPLTSSMGSEQFIIDSLNKIADRQI